tara:strand:- start:925 stop:1653 length:729 start_codon:yes stop_codon:yes gene_type:complete
MINPTQPNPTQPPYNMSYREQRKQEKRDRILKNALALFSVHSYSGTSMDAIAAAAKISKPTLYEYFGNKEGLFSAVFEKAVDEILEPFRQTEGKGMVALMVEFSWQYADLVLRPDMLSLSRLVIGEVERFPDVGRRFHEAGPQQAVTGIIRFLEQYRAEGLLEFTDGELAANDLWSLILSALYDLCLHTPGIDLSKQEIGRYLYNGLRVFLMGYAKDPGPQLKELEIQKSLFAGHKKKVHRS